MKQKQYSPLTVSELALTLYAIDRGFFDGVKVERALKAEEDLQAHMQSSHSALMEKVEKEPKLTDEVESELKAAVKSFFDSLPQ